VPGLQPDESPRAGAQGLGGAARLVHLGAMPRILIASLVGILGFLAYLGVTVALADHVLTLHWALQIPFFLAAGIAWAWPARWLMFWGAGQR
jgi:hypothetical protein